MQNLDSEEEAKILIENLIPEPRMRYLCLHMFMDAIDEANFYGQDQWYLEPAFDGHIWLVTGSLVTCSLVENRIWLSLNRHLMATQSGLSLIYDSPMNDWNWEPVDLNDPTWIHIPTVINGFYTPGPKHDLIWPHLRRLLFETIYQSVMTQNSFGYVMPKVHSPGILAYIQKETGREVRSYLSRSYLLA